jgi:stage II sporulation protein AA (anti-sigma F factor antagonist)
MIVTDQSVEGVRVVEIAGRIDSPNAPKLQEQLGALLSAGNAPVLIDMGKVEYITSAGFRVLLLLARQAKQSQCRFALCALNPKVKQLFDLGGFLDLLPIAQTREEGIAAAR